MSAERERRVREDSRVLSWIRKPVETGRLEGVIAEDVHTGERRLRHRNCVTEREVIKGDIPESFSRGHRTRPICATCGKPLRLLDSDC